MAATKRQSTMHITHERSCQIISNSDRARKYSKPTGQIDMWEKKVYKIMKIFSCYASECGIELKFMRVEKLNDNQIIVFTRHCQLCLMNLSQFLELSQDVILSLKRRVINSLIMGYQVENYLLKNVESLRGKKFIKNSPLLSSFNAR